MKISAQRSLVLMPITTMTGTVIGATVTGSGTTAWTGTVVPLVTTGGAGSAIGKRTANEGAFQRLAEGKEAIQSAFVYFLKLFALQ